MAPTDEQIEKYLWGEALPPEEEILYERAVSRDRELQRSFHQVRRLIRRFQLLREKMADSEESERHRWFARSLTRDPIPISVRKEVMEVVSELFGKSYPTAMIKAEVTRRIGDPNEEEEILDEHLDLDLQEFMPREESARYIVSRSMSAPSSMDFEPDPFEPRKQSALERKQDEIMQNFPQLIQFLRSNYRTIYLDWRAGNARVRVLRRLHKESGQPSLMAVLDLIDLVGGQGITH